MSKVMEIFASLGAKFAKEQERERPQGNRKLKYVTARAVMNRLDDVLGPENWWDEYIPQEHSVICKLTVRLPDGSTLTKSDAGGYAGMSDQGDDDKSGFSDAFKRAAVKFGIGRYLYGDGVPRFVIDELTRRKEQRQAASESARPDHPSPSPEPTPAKPQDAPVKRPAPPHQDNRPTTGRALFAWLKQRGEKDGVDYVSQINEYAKTVGWPTRMIDYTRDQVDAAVAGILGEEVAAS